MKQNQLNTLKAAIIADPVAGPLRAAGDAYSLLQWCNTETTTLAWRIAVGADEIYSAHKITDYLLRSPEERQAFDLMVASGRYHDFTVAAKRNGVADIFSGTTNSSSRTGIFAIAQEFATNAQVAVGGTVVSVGGTGKMSETVSALRRNTTELITAAEANFLVN